MKMAQKRRQHEPLLPPQGPCAPIQALTTSHRSKGLLPDLPAAYLHPTAATASLPTVSQILLFLGIKHSSPGISPLV